MVDHRAGRGGDELTGPARFVCALLALALGAGCGSGGEGGDATPGDGATIVIDRVIDGDSLEATVDGEATEIRLLGINAPELRTLDGDETCPGQMARDELVGLLEGADSLAFEAGDTDRFGRRLGVIVADGEPVTRSMVEAGWALGLWSAEDPTLTAAMEAAAEAERGWWGDDCGQRAQPVNGPIVVIADAQPDPPGDDRERLDDEWIEVANVGTGPADLTGWTIRDETTSNRFTLDGLVVPDGGRVRIRTGPGQATDTDFYLGLDTPIWSNDGDTVLLETPTGLITTYRFLT